MTEKELRDLIKEREHVELKSSLSLMNEIIQAISAFSNTKGGRVIIGVDDSEKVLGVEIGKGTIENLANTIGQNTEPKVQPTIKVETIDNKKIIIIEVKESLDKLVLAFGRPFKRVGKSSPRMSKDEYERLILEKHREKLYFDSQICKGATLEDINTSKLKIFLEKVRFERKLEISPNVSVKEVLEKLNLMKDGSLTNAAIFLFGKNPQKFFLQAETRCARFKGNKPLEFIDMKVFGGNIIEQREDALEFVKEHIKLRAEIKGTERIEKWEYPIEALRESITNAICHRDYKISGNVQIRIFDDRIEIWGCGPLPEPLTPTDLRREHKSILRNPLIGRSFFLIKFIEEWGTGTNRMIEACLKEGLPEPIFEEASGNFLVVFRKYHISEETLEELNERQKKIVDYLRGHKKINRKICMELLGTSKDTAIRELSSLQVKGIIERAGKGKNVYYHLV